MPTSSTITAAPPETGDHTGHRAIHVRSSRAGYTRANEWGVGPILTQPNDATMCETLKEKAGPSREAHAIVVLLRLSAWRRACRDQETSEVESFAESTWQTRKQSVWRTRRGPSHAPMIRRRLVTTQQSMQATRPMGAMTHYSSIRRPCHNNSAV